MWRIWIILAGLFLILESITTGFLVFWFAVGSIVAMLVSFFINNIITQTSVFLISSCILIFTTRKFCDKFLSNKESSKINNVSGKIGKVTVDIEPFEGAGQIKIDGEVWSAISSDNTSIPKGTEVIIEKIDGVKVVVTPKK